jgi:hypothetical protein
MQKSFFDNLSTHLSLRLLFWRRSSRGSPGWPGLNERGLNSRQLAEARPAEARRACRRAAFARPRARRDSGTSKGNGRARPRQACVKSRTPGAIAQQRPASLGSCDPEAARARAGPWRPRGPGRTGPGGPCLRLRAPSLAIPLFPTLPQARSLAEAPPKFEPCHPHEIPHHRKQSFYSDKGGLSVAGVKMPRTCRSSAFSANPKPLR